MFKETEIKDNNKRRYLNIFRNKSISAYWLACHAALPLFFRTDWLFHLWSNFKDDILNTTGNVPSYSDIADVVHSPFTNVVGIDFFEIDNEIRDHLLYDLQQKFGKPYIERLASFLFQYTQNVNLTEMEKDAHQATAWSIVYPQQAAREIGKAFSRAVENGDQVEQDRLHFVLDSMTSPFMNEVKESFEQIINVTGNNKDFNFEGILKSFPRITYYKPNTNAISLRIPKGLKKRVEENNKELLAVQKLNGILKDISSLRFSFVESSEIMRNDETEKLTYATDKKGNLTGIRINNIDLGKTIDQIFKAADWKYLTHLSLTKCNIDTISFIRINLIKKLGFLNLSDNHVYDISPLSALKKITRLVLSNNYIEDISPLVSLTNLCELNIAKNKLANISPLEGLSSLTRIILSNNRLNDFSPLRGLTNLVRIDLENNPIKELPDWICNLPNMDIQWGKEGHDNFITLHDNPIESPPIKIVKQGKKAIKYWFNQKNKIKPEDKQINQFLDSSKFFKDNELLFTGFNHNFLHDDIVRESVPFPILDYRQKTYLAPVEYRNKSYLDYLNYSLQLSSSRKFPIFTASNIDGKLFKRTLSKGVWRKDPRAGEYQWGIELYRAQKSGFDKGRITKGQDVQWGETQILAHKAVESTYFYTNVVPQHKFLNRLTYWQALVNHILNSGTRKKSMKICVFAGPVLSKNDPSFVIPINGEKVLLPTLFWKVVIYPKEDGRLYRVGFMINQEKFLLEDGIIVKSEHDSETDTDNSFKEFYDTETYQVNISLIERITGLKMPDAIDSYKDNHDIKSIKQAVETETESNNYIQEKSQGLSLLNIVL